MMTTTENAAEHTARQNSGIVRKMTLSLFNELYLIKHRGDHPRVDFWLVPLSCKAHPAFDLYLKLEIVSVEVKSVKAVDDMRMARTSYTETDL